ncbi:uncharacterized protein LOC115089750 isoform X2 [Rhinatrema bivittatum]|uniref:uncharacterized protein LOC115089750 isoform X2 n=1 Tax=Rhinatrema bivittatum TaxID=194408 RepID=UPI001128C48F|nr:uncharacterized protein LOC115089750 isoform X2 [Rhinatrema bivittatum]
MTSHKILEKVQKKLRGKAKAPASAAEAARFLPEDAKEARGNERKLKQAAKEVLKCVPYAFKKSKSKSLLEEAGAPPQPDADQILDSLIVEGKFLDACKLIYGQDANRKKKEILYEQVACSMWLVVEEALSGQENVRNRLPSVMAAVEWERKKKEETLQNSDDASPALKWKPQLENLIKKDITSQIARSPPVDKSDTTSILDYLETLKSTLLQRSDRLRQEVDLLTIYIRSFQDCMLSHISTLISADCSRKVCMALYQWGSANFKSTFWNLVHLQRTEGNLGLSEKAFSTTDHGMHRQNMEILDLSFYCDWIATNEKKLIEMLQSDIKESLNKILNCEKQFLTNSLENDLHFHFFCEIIQVLTGAIEEVQDSSTKLANKVQVLCQEELLQFVSSFEHFICKQLLDPGQCSGTRIDQELRVLEDSCILRETWRRLAQICPECPEMSKKVEESIVQTEDQGRKYFLQTLTSALKKALKNHFRDDCDDFAEALSYLNQRLTRFEGSKTESYTSLVKLAHHRVVVEYLRVFLTSAKKFASADLHVITSRVEEEGKKMQDIFQRCLSPDADAALGNPFPFIVRLLRATNLEIMKMETFCFVDRHSDLREEHINVILDIKRTFNQKERELILEYVKNRKEDQDQEMHFFEEIKVSQSTFAGIFCPFCV